MPQVDQDLGLATHVYRLLKKASGRKELNLHCQAMTEEEIELLQ